MPPTLNNVLISIGKIIGQITILALVAGLFIAPVTAMLMASFYIALEESRIPSRWRYPRQPVQS